MHLIGPEMVRDAFGAPHLGRKVPQNCNFGAKMVKGPHHEERLTRDRGKRPSLWGLAPLSGAGAPRGGGSLKYIFLPQIPIFGHYLTPKKGSLIL